MVERNLEFGLWREIGLKINGDFEDEWRMKMMENKGEERER